METGGGGRDLNPSDTGTQGSKEAPSEEPEEKTVGVTKGHMEKVPMSEISQKPDDTSKPAVLLQDKVTNVDSKIRNSVEDVKGSSAASASTISSGIGSELAKSSESNADTMSLSSGSGGTPAAPGAPQPQQQPQTQPHTQPQPHSHTTNHGKRVLTLAQKGEWLILDQYLRSLEKLSPDVNVTDEVRKANLHETYSSKPL